MAPGVVRPLCCVPALWRLSIALRTPRRACLWYILYTIGTAVQCLSCLDTICECALRYMRFLCLCFLCLLTISVCARCTARVRSSSISTTICLASIASRAVLCFYVLCVVLGWCWFLLFVRPRPEMQAMTFVCFDFCFWKVGTLRRDSPLLTFLSTPRSMPGSLCCCTVEAANVAPVHFAYAR